MTPLKVQLIAIGPYLYDVQRPGIVLAMPSTLEQCVTIPYALLRYISDSLIYRSTTAVNPYK